MLRRPRTRPPPLGQERARRLLPARLQPPPRRRRPAVGLLQPARLRLGAGLLRRPTSEGETPPRRPARARKPLARSALALPQAGRALQRERPRRQPQPGPPTAPESRLNDRRLTEGGSLVDLPEAADEPDRDDVHREREDEERQPDGEDRLVLERARGDGAGARRRRA